MRRGLSIVEVLLSTVVIGGVTYAAAPKFVQAAKRAKETAVKAELKTIRQAVDHFFLETGGYPNTISDMIGDKPPEIFWVKGQMAKWGKRSWEGPYLAYGEKGRDFVPKDHISGKSYRASRAENGRLTILSSADGKDSDGVRFSDY